jgi:hypothetical protein
VRSTTHEMRAAGYNHIEGRAWVMASLNSRARQLLIDPTADLSTKRYGISHNDWILPLIQPPSPAPAQANLFVSRRQGCTLILVNATEEPFPLWSLQFRMDHVWFAGPGFDRPDLALEKCVVAQPTQPNPDLISPNCTEVSTRLRVESECDHGPLNISTNGEESVT